MMITAMGVQDQEIAGEYMRLMQPQGEPSTTLDNSSKLEIKKTLH